MAVAGLSTPANLKADVGASSKNPHADTAHAVKETSAQNKGKAATLTAKEGAIPQKVAPVLNELRVELAGHARLHYNGNLYEAGVVYNHSRPYAEHLLSLTGPKGLPQFKIHAPVKAKPITQQGKPLVNMVAIKTGNSAHTVEPAVPTAAQAEAAGAHQGFDIGDDADPELQAHLAAAAAEGAGEGGEGEQNEAHVTV